MKEIQAPKVSYSRLVLTKHSKEKYIQDKEDRPNKLNQVTYSYDEFITLLAPSTNKDMV